MSRVLTSKEWQQRRQRAARHLEWARDGYISNTATKRGLVGVAVGTSLLATVTRINTWLHGSSVVMASTILLGVLLVLLGGGYSLFPSYKRWIVHQLVHLPFRSGEIVLTHRWWGVDEVTTRMMYMTNYRPAESVRLFSSGANAFTTQPLAMLLSDLWHARGDSTATTCSLLEVLDLVRVIESHYEDFNSFVEAVWNLYIKSEAERGAQEEVLVECTRAIQSCGGEFTRKALVEMAQSAQLGSGERWSSATGIVREIERCAKLVSHGA